MSTPPATPHHCTAFPRRAFVEKSAAALLLAPLLTRAAFADDPAKFAPAEFIAVQKAAADWPEYVAFVRRRLCLPADRDPVVAEALVSHPAPVAAMVTVSWDPSGPSRVSSTG